MSLGEYVHLRLLGTARAGTATAANTPAHDSVVAMPIRRMGGSGTSARAVHQVVEVQVGGRRAGAAD